MLDYTKPLQFKTDDGQTNIRVIRTNWDCSLVAWTDKHGKEKDTWFDSLGNAVGLQDKLVNIPKEPMLDLNKPMRWKNTSYTYKEFRFVEQNDDYLCLCVTRNDSSPENVGNYYSFQLVDMEELENIPEHTQPGWRKFESGKEALECGVMDWVLVSTSGEYVKVDKLFVSIVDMPFKIDGCWYTAELAMKTYEHYIPSTKETTPFGIYTT